MSTISYNLISQEELEKKKCEIDSYKKFIKSYIINIINNINKQQKELNIKINQLNIFKDELISKMTNIIKDIDDKENELIDWIEDNNIELNIELINNSSDLNR